jgi:hypothetical protein
MTQRHVKHFYQDKLLSVSGSERPKTTREAGRRAWFAAPPDGPPRTANAGWARLVGRPPRRRAGPVWSRPAAGRTVSQKVGKKYLTMRKPRERPRPDPEIWREAGPVLHRPAARARRREPRRADQRAPRQHAQDVALAGGQHFQLHRPGRQVVQRLLADQAEHPGRPGGLLGLSKVPAGEIRRAEVDDLALARGRL